MVEENLSVPWTYLHYSFLFNFLIISDTVLNGHVKECSVKFQSLAFIQHSYNLTGGSLRRKSCNETFVKFFFIRY